MAKVAGKWNSHWTGGANSHGLLDINEDGTGSWNGPTSRGSLQGRISVNGAAFVGTYTFTDGSSGDCAFVAQGDTLSGVWGDGKLWDGTRSSGSSGSGMSGGRSGSGMSGGSSGSGMSGGSSGSGMSGGSSGSGMK